MPHSLTAHTKVPVFIQPALHKYNNSFQLCYRGSVPLGKSFPVIVEGCEATGKLRIMVPVEAKKQYTEQGFKTADADVREELETWGKRPSYQITIEAKDAEFFKTAEAIHAKLSAMYQLVPAGQNDSFRKEMEDPSSRTGYRAPASKTVH